MSCWSMAKLMMKTFCLITSNRSLYGCTQPLWFCWSLRYLSLFAMTGMYFSKSNILNNIFTWHTELMPDYESVRSGYLGLLDLQWLIQVGNLLYFITIILSTDITSRRLQLKVLNPITTKCKKLNEWHCFQSRRTMTFMGESLNMSRARQWLPWASHTTIKVCVI